jgi:MerR family transcriptional regulator, light-induced transcriptional regulator
VSTLGSFAASLLRASARAYAAAVVGRLTLDWPGFQGTALPPQFAQPIDDVEVRILQLAAAVEWDRPALFEHALQWYKVAFHHRQVHADYLPQCCMAMAAVLRAELPVAAAALVRRHLELGIQALAAAPTELPSHLAANTPTGRLAAQFLLAILEGRGDDAVALVRQALAAGMPVARLHDEVLTPVQRETGRLWVMGEIPIADEHYGSQVVDRVLWLLHDQIPRPAADAPVVATLAVGGNLHDLGIRMVAQRLLLAGFNVYHLGANMPLADVEVTFADRRVALVALSATMAIHLRAVADAIAMLRRSGMAKLPVLVGGEPFRLVGDLAELLGADAGATDAASAAVQAKRLLAWNQKCCDDQ